MWKLHMWNDQFQALEMCFTCELGSICEINFICEKGFTCKIGFTYEMGCNFTRETFTCETQFYIWKSHMWNIVYVIFVSCILYAMV